MARPWASASAEVATNTFAAIGLPAALLPASTTTISPLAARDAATTPTARDRSPLLVTTDNPNEATCRARDSANAGRRVTIRTSRSGNGCSGRRGCSAPTLNGRVNRNVEPTCLRLSTPMVPPMRSVSSLQIARPRPVPPNFRVVDSSAWVNGLNILPTVSASMPIPESVTENCTGALLPFVLASLAPTSTRTTISP